MKIEIVEFYVHYYNEGNGHFIGTLHVFLPDFNMDLRGITFESNKKTRKRLKSGIYMEMPYARRFDHAQKKVIKFPIISFIDDKLNKALKDVIYQQGVEYILKNFFEKTPTKKEEKQPEPAVL